MKCYVCDTELTKENETEEHILLNAIGGRLRSKKLICKDCNSEFGSTIDDSLAYQLNPIANLLDVKRDRGKPQNVKGKIGLKEIIIEPGGKMKLARPYIDKGEKVVHIEASTVGEATKVLKGLKRKFPDLDIDEAVNNSKKRKNFLPSVTINMNFGGNEIKRAICKMAVNYFIFSGGNPETIKHLLPYIQGIEKEAEVYYFYPRQEVFYKGEKDVIHTLLLVGDPEKKELFVYIELFNEFKMLVFLDKEFDGEHIYNSYHYNVVTNEIIDYEASIRFTSKDLRKYSLRDIIEQKFKERMTLLFQRIDKVISDRRIHEITTNAMEEMSKKYPQEENPFFTPEMIAYFSNRVAEEFVLSFQHRLFKEKHETL